MHISKDAPIIAAESIGNIRLDDRLLSDMDYTMADAVGPKLRVTKRKAGGMFTVM